MGLACPNNNEGGGCHDATRRFALAGTALVSFSFVEAQARIVRLEITKTEPAFGGRGFGEIGVFERITGKAHGEVDPQSPANAMIQDIALAPRNAKGMVEYTIDVDIVRPSDRTKSNGVVFFNIVNRGNKGGLTTVQRRHAGGLANVANINGLTEAGDGFMQQQGYTMVWFGWQPDVISGNNRLTMKVPVARNADGSAITGVVRNETHGAASDHDAQPAERMVHAGAVRPIRQSAPTTRRRLPTAFCRP